MSNPVDILVFAKTVMYGGTQVWGKHWSQRSIDGIFFNRYLNEDFVQALRETRLRFLGSEAPPFPANWDDDTADQTFPPPWGKNRAVRDKLREVIFTEVIPSKGPVRPWITVLPTLDKLADTFSVDRRYVEAAYLHGTPIPFKPYVVGFETEWPPDYDPHKIIGEKGGLPLRELRVGVDIPVFKVTIYSLPFAGPEMDGVVRAYENYLADVVPEIVRSGMSEVAKQTAGRVGANLTADFISSGVQCLQIKSYPRFAAPKELSQLVLRALETYGERLPGTKTHRQASNVIRAWCVYLMATKGQLTARKAIQKWDENFPSIAYNADKWNVITTPGETQFSRDRKELEERVSYYETILSQEHAIELS